MIALLGCLLLLTLVSGQPHDGRYGLTYPDEQTLRTYVDGFDEKEIQRVELEQKGAWTVWMDRDFPKPWGTGEFESVLRERVEDYKRGKCHMWCEHPKAMELKLSDLHDNRTTSTLHNALFCVVTNPEVYNPDTGYECNTYDQWERAHDYCDPDTCLKNGLGHFCEYCPDVQIRYFCTGEIFCMPAAKRGLDGDKEFRKQLKVLGAAGAEDMLISLDSPESPKRKLKEKKSLENEATDLLARLLRVLRSEKKN